MSARGKRRREPTADEDAATVKAMNAWLVNHGKAAVRLAEAKAALLRREAVHVEAFAEKTRVALAIQARLNARKKADARERAAEAKRYEAGLRKSGWWTVTREQALGKVKPKVAVVARKRRGS